MNIFLKTKYFYFSKELIEINCFVFPYAGLSQDSDAVKSIVIKVTISWPSYVVFNDGYHLGNSWLDSIISTIIYHLVEIRNWICWANFFDTLFLIVYEVAVFVIPFDASRFLLCQGSCLLNLTRVNLIRFCCPTNSFLVDKISPIYSFFLIFFFFFFFYYDWELSRKLLDFLLSLFINPTITFKLCCYCWIKLR